MIAAALTIPYTKDNGIHAETLCTSKEWSERFKLRKKYPWNGYLPDYYGWKRNYRSRMKGEKR